MTLILKHIPLFICFKSPILYRRVTATRANLEIHANWIRVYFSLQKMNVREKNWEWNIRPVLLFVYFLDNNYNNETK